MPAARTVITVVSNRRARSVYQIRQAILDILSGEGYHLPPIAASVYLYENSPTLGIDSAVNAVRRFHATANPGYDCSEVDLNSYAYVLLRADRTADAIKVFQLNTALYPNSFNVLR
jgi:hypothetical protein